MTRYFFQRWCKNGHQVREKTFNIINYQGENIKITMQYHLTPVIFFLVVVQSLSCVPHGLQHAKLLCPSPPPRACSNSCLLSWWCHPTISSSVLPFSSCLQSFPASRSFLMSQRFASGSQSIGASASVLPMNIQDWFSLGLTGLGIRLIYLTE